MTSPWVRHRNGIHRPSGSTGGGGIAIRAAAARVVQRLPTMTAGIRRNWTTGLTSERSLIAYDHQQKVTAPTV
jgi:hypothetical protein